MSELTDAADRLAEQAADASDNDESATNDAAPELVPVNIGGRTIELPPDQAEQVRTAFDSLAGRYGSELENLRRNYATPAPQPVYVPVPAQTPQSNGFAVPDPDLMFKDKRVWEQEFDRQLSAREARLRADTEALVHTAMGMVQNELNAREQRAQAQAYEGQLFEGLLDKHENLRGKEAFVYSVMDEVYDDIRHLPAPVAYDRLGEIAESRLHALTGGAPARVAAPPATPRVLSSGRRSSADATPPARISISDRIEERQQRFLGARPAAPAGKVA